MKTMTFGHIWVWDMKTISEWNCFVKVKLYITLLNTKVAFPNQQVLNLEINEYFSCWKLEFQIWKATMFYWGILISASQKSKLNFWNFIVSNMKF